MKDVKFIPLRFAVDEDGLQYICDQNLFWHIVAKPCVTTPVRDEVQRYLDNKWSTVCAERKQHQDNYHETVIERQKEYIRVLKKALAKIRDWDEDNEFDDPGAFASEVLKKFDE